MANSIALAKQYTTMLDEVYKLASLSADLDGAANLMREGYNANEIVIPKLSMNGLGNYSRNDGYVKGDATLTYETVKCEFDRGRMFSVDNLDNIETGGVAFGRLAGGFVREKVVPELDAYRFAKYAKTTGIGEKTETLTSGADVIAALRAASDKMDEDEVPYEGRILKITPTVLGLVEDMDTTKSRAVLARFSSVTKVPQSRFYTAITQYDGSSDGQTAGGYVKKAVETQSFTGDGSTKVFTVTAKPKVIDKVTVDGTEKTITTDFTYEASTGVITFGTAPANAKAVVASYNGARDINFMIIHPSALIQFNKLVKPKIITPEVNNDGDAWKYGYRHVSIADVYENKVAGIYCSHK